MKEHQNISIRIADVAPISLTVKPADEEVVREAERGVNKVWQTWRSQFDEKTSKEVLAMVAFQFAKLFFSLQHTVEAREKAIGEFEAELDRLLQLTASHNDIAK